MSAIRVGLAAVLICACGLLLPSWSSSPADCWIALRATFRVTSQDGGEPSAADLESDRQVVESLIASIGFAEFAVRTSGTTLEIYLPESAQPDEIREALRPAGHFHFVPIPPGRSVEPGDAIPPNLRPLFGRDGVASAVPGFTQTGERALDLALTDEAVEILNNWAEDNVGNQLAIVAGGRVISAPFIREPRFGRLMQISGPEVDIQRLLPVLRAPQLHGLLEEVAFESFPPPEGCEPAST